MADGAGRSLFDNVPIVFAKAVIVKNTVAAVAFVAQRISIGCL
jgi:hypothetical protein